MGWLIGMIDKLLPPDSPEGRWKTMMSIAVGIIAIGLLWGWGFMPGLQGFAQTVQLEAIKRTVEETQKKTELSVGEIRVTQNVILARLIVSDVEQARAQQCQSLKDGNANAAQGWRTRLDGALYEYRQATGRDYSLRPCSEY